MSANIVVNEHPIIRRMLASDFITPEEIMRARAYDGLVTYTDDDLARFAEMSDKITTGWCQDKRMIVVAGPPKAMSLLDVRTLKPSYFWDQRGSCWYAEEAQKFSRDDKVEPAWIALCKKPVSGSLGKNWPEQQKCLFDPMVVPNVAEVAWCVTVYHAVRDIRLLSNGRVRTSSVDSDGDHTDVGFHDAEGLCVSGCWDDSWLAYLGIAGSRRF